MINISFLFMYYSFNFICVGKTTCLVKLHIEENIMQPIAFISVYYSSKRRCIFKSSNSEKKHTPKNNMEISRRSSKLS